MIKKCVGCGAILQSYDKNKPGFIEENLKEEKPVCERCFRIKNYGDYKDIEKDIENYEQIFNDISIKNDLVLFLCDIFTLDNSLNFINKFDKNVILVITKKDLLPKSVKEYKIKNYIKNNFDIKFKDIVFVSSKKNYNIDLLMNLINKYKTSKNVYLVGNTNAGKSSLLNKIIKSNNLGDKLITTSPLPATTIDLINIKINDDLTLIDTPGLVNLDNFSSNLNASLLKKVIPKTEIKPRTYQLRPNQSLLIDDYARIDYLSGNINSFTVYISNELKVSRINQETNNRLKNENKKNISLEDKKDIVISGLCFIKITKKASINVYTKEDVSVFIRDNLI